MRTLSDLNNRSTCPLCPVKQCKRMKLSQLRATLTAVAVIVYVELLHNTQSTSGQITWKLTFFLSFSNERRQQ